MNNNENAVKILEIYFKEIYKSLGKEWTEKNEADMKNIVEYLNGNLPEEGTVIDFLDNGSVKTKLNDGRIMIIDRLENKK